MRYVSLVAALWSEALPVALFLSARLPRLPHKTIRISAVLVLTGALAVGWLFLDSFYVNMLGAGNLMSRPEIVIAIAIIISWLMCFFAGVHPAREQVCRPGENELWRALPVRPFVRSLVRFTVLYLLLLPVHLFCCLPALLVFFRSVPLDARFLAGAALCALLPPVIPAALDLALALLLRRFPRFSRRALALEIGIPAAIIILIALAQAALQRSLFEVARSSDLIFPVKAAIFLGSLVEAVPPAHWLASTLRPGREVVPLLLATGCAALAAVPVIVWAARVPETAEYGRARPRRSFPGSRLLSGILARPLPALISREAVLFISRRPLVFEAVLRLLILPSFLIFYAAGGPREVTVIVADFIASSPAAAVIAVCLVLFLVDISFLAATGFSREGRIADLSFTLPWDGSTQAKAKTLFLLCLALPPAGAALTLVYLLFPVPLESLVCAIPGTAAYLVFSIASGLLIDYRRPVFAVAGPVSRQNSNTILAVSVEVFVLALLGAIAYGAVSLGLPPLAAAFLAVQLLIGLDIVLLPRLFRLATRSLAAVRVTE